VAFDAAAVLTSRTGAPPNAAGCPMSGGVADKTISLT
jgi:hypothetical protein